MSNSISTLSRASPPPLRPIPVIARNPHPALIIAGISTPSPHHRRNLPALTLDPPLHPRLPLRRKLTPLHRPLPRQNFSKLRRKLPSLSLFFAGRSPSIGLLFEALPKAPLPQPLLRRKLPSLGLVIAISSLPSASSSPEASCPRHRRKPLATAGIISPSPLPSNSRVRSSSPKARHPRHSRKHSDLAFAVAHLAGITPA
ncbi:hypothetical protein BJ508DRAFT_49906 [Ascobolus immersus RN42]|uniref:Uncharacterized protein n=1 Tax=Ascobolus immersus RN42 TaxID=1160509 RepID=A0A3N4HKI3_ASCIM|nr:hypothetical protein BJ508DRAFT_49906 [Ascobolus immersus RN42]